MGGVSVGLLRGFGPGGVEVGRGNVLLLVGFGDLFRDANASMFRVLARHATALQSA
jgi:hypothetical protein